MHLKRALLHNDILTEFLPPSKPSNKVIVLCDGMPSMPSKKSLVRMLAKKGYWVFHPRYRGTWESEGQFLDHDPTQDILDVIEALPRGFKSIWDGKTFSITPDRTLVIGHSFGGTAAILSTLSDKVTKAISLAPVIDWTVASPEEPMDWLEGIVTEGYNGGYRFAHEDWVRLSNGEFYQPATVVEQLDPSKLYLVQAEDDKAVPAEPAHRFVERLGCAHTFLKSGGHDIVPQCLRFPLVWKLMKFLNT